MASIIVREIDETLWRQVKSKAAMEGLTLKALVVEFLEGYVKKPVAVVQRKAAAK